MLFHCICDASDDRCIFQCMCVVCFPQAFAGLNLTGKRNLQALSEFVLVIITFLNQRLIWWLTLPLSLLKFWWFMWPILDNHIINTRRSNISCLIFYFSCGIIKSDCLTFVFLLFFFLFARKGYGPMEREDLSWMEAISEALQHVSVTCLSTLCTLV